MSRFAALCLASVGLLSVAAMGGCTTEGRERPLPDDGPEETGGTGGSPATTGGRGGTTSTGGRGGSTSTGGTGGGGTGGSNSTGGTGGSGGTGGTGGLGGTGGSGGAGGSQKLDAGVDAATDTRGGGMDARDAGAGPTFQTLFDEVLYRCQSHHGTDHKGVNLQGNPDMLYMKIVNAKAEMSPDTDCRPQVLITPGRPELSLLYQKMIPNGDLKRCGGRMPPSCSVDPSTCLTKEQTDMVRDWILGGAKR